MTGSRVKSFTTERFRELLKRMPPDARKLARKYFKTFLDDPWAPTLGRKALQSSEGLEFVRIGLHYRAFFRKGLFPGDENVVVWEWIGTTEEAHNYYWKSFPISEPHPNRPPCRRIPKTGRYMKTWKTPKFIEEEPVMSTSAVEEPERPTEESKVEPQKALYTGVAAQLETLLSTIHEIETKKTQAERDAEAGLAESVRLDGENKALRAQIEALQKDLESEKASLRLAISKARDAAISHKHDAEGLNKRIEDLNRSNADLSKQVVTLQKRIRKLGEFCRHCGKNYEMGLRPGETD